MSSCPDDQPEVSQEEARVRREEEVYEKAKSFLRQVVVNLCIPEGITGRFDIAFKVDRQKEIMRAMKDLVKEFEQSEEQIGQG